MVAFGLFGVLWQNTTQRIPEIGLRRAVGASAADIYRQIVAEQLLLSSAGDGARPGAAGAAAADRRAGRKPELDRLRGAAACRWP
jgi:hypothetical protein